MRLGSGLALVLMLGACHGNPVGEAAADGALGGSGGRDASDDAAGGSDADSGPIAPELLASGRDCPADLRVTGGSVTWVDQGSLQKGANDGIVATRPAAGCGDAGACISVLAENQHGPSAVEIDPLTNTIYWATLNDGSIWRLTPPATTPESFASAQNEPRWLAIDDTALYWTNQGAGAADGEVRREYLDGGTPGGLAIVSALDSPLAIVVMGTTIYFTNDGTSETTGYVSSNDISGGNPKALATDQSHPRGIAVDATHVYWTNMGDGSVMRSNHDGSAAARILSGLLTPSDLAVDAKALYWVEAGTPNQFADGRVMAKKLDTGEIATIAEGELDPRRIVLDATHVYWLDRGTQGLSPCTQHDGKVLRAPKPW